MSNEGKGRGRFRCPRCLYRFQYRSQVDRHLKNKKQCLTLDEMPMGPTPDLLKCAGCRHTFSTHSNLLRHQRSGKCREPTFVDRDPRCPFCDKVFSRADSRKRHVDSRCPVRKAQQAEREKRELALVAPEEKQLGSRIVELERELERARLAPAGGAAGGAAGGPGGPTANVRTGGSSVVDVDNSVGKTVDNSVNVYGQEEIPIDGELLAALEHELRNTDMASSSYARLKLVERLIFRGLQSRPENRTIRGFDGARVGVHLGGDRWERREAREVAKTTASAIEERTVRRLRAEGAATPLIRRALGAPGIDPKEREVWADFSGRMIIGSVGRNNEKRVAGEDVEIVLA